MLDLIASTREAALRQASRAQIHRELLEQPLDEDTQLIVRAAEALELVILDLLLAADKDDEEAQRDLRLCAADAFRLLRALPRPTDPVEAAAFLLRAGALAVLGDKGADAARWLSEEPWPELAPNTGDWRTQTWSTILDVWLRLIRKRGWTDRDAVLEGVARLRDAQTEFEQQYLEGQDPATAKAAALELIGLYHLAKAAEILALYITDGVVDGKYQIQQLLETHFDRVLTICQHAQMLDLEPLSRLLAASAVQMAENSIWTVTRAVNSRVTQFVRTLVDRGRGDRAIFDVLPPQRRTLAEKGLLGSSRRAVVVSLPTSSGKTLIAQFRILQALNQFEMDRGWVAYLAPTRTLVNQIARRLRKEFEPLDIVVEQVSPAIEVDNIEAELLRQSDPSAAFRVLVTTPEKLDLMLRQGWEAKIERPLTLVVVDEAHNLSDFNRGLKLELLLATINSECQRAQFLLLTPFISNAREVARWLGGTNSEDVSLALDWQPNDRVIGIVEPEKGDALGANSFDYSLRMETQHTTRQTLAVDELLRFPKTEEIARTFSKVSDQGTLAAATAQQMQRRGPVIVMHQRPDWVWSLADKLRIDANRRQAASERIELVRAFLDLEMGADFPLQDLLAHGIGVHHAGLSDDVRALMEWLFEEGELSFLVATTTIAQGVNFPVTGVVLASHQYPSNRPPYMTDIPPEDFWNIAGRAGRIGQGSLGVVALVADSQAKADRLRTFINRQTGDLNSALISLATEAADQLGDLGGIVYSHPEWSAFVQYLAHTYRQMGQPDGFADEIEQILRGTFGFDRLRAQHDGLASQLLDGVHAYSAYLGQPGQPLKLVDSTGFSLQTVKTVLHAAREYKIGVRSWDKDRLFSRQDSELQSMMGVLLRVPELRENLKAATGGKEGDGDKLAMIVKDWVNGATLPQIAEIWFKTGDEDLTVALTNCGKNLFGKLTQSAAWGLGALLSITGSDLPEEQLSALSNLPSRVFYGVGSDDAVALRLLGVPRSAAPRLADSMGNIATEPLTQVRTRLRGLDQGAWQGALGQREGEVYRKVWRVLEGLE
ncbi:DEAD/DEAH box helicase [Thiorhodococcus mannitoliphagus]|uniref:DEAD/DEAH box helicase n=1 Tax=Thiorhodococcus mannitoliphagus TaxID=329406 RepID=UPI001F0F7B96|nr:DEAD/DEAH box helicase [Thiorhodococcus mannitoliphagus]